MIYRFEIPSDGDDVGPDLPREKQHAQWRKNGDIATGLTEKIDRAVTLRRDRETDCLVIIRNRIMQSMNTQLLLYTAEHDYQFDAAVVLRGMYDVHLQGLYILKNPAVHAPEFMDFIAVQIRELVDLMEKNGSDMADSIRRNPLFAVARPHVDFNYTRVRAKFLTNKGDKCRDNWYKGTLATLAGDVGLLPEYEIMQRTLSGSVHSTPHALILGAGLPLTAFINYGWILTFRILGGIARHLQLPLDEFEHWATNFAQRSLFDMNFGNG